MLKVGDVKINNQGINMKVIEYNGWGNVIVQFDDGLIRKTTASNFRRGQVLNYNYPTLYKKGYLGAKESKEVIYSLVYDTWHGMIRRCYSNEKKYKAYFDCQVCEEWLNFQNFKKWFNENYWKCGNERMCLDKDILHKNNKIYCPNNCMIVPNTINIMFVKNYAKNKCYPKGVNKCKTGISYTIFEKDKPILKYIRNATEENIQKAFNEYKKSKEQHFKDVADLYKSKYPNFPQKLYDAMYAYEVEITD